MGARAEPQWRWPAIACELGHPSHRYSRIPITLDGPTAYTDCSPIPQHLRTDFEFDVWGEEYPEALGGPYCPAYDNVSQTIREHGVWEPHETILALAVCSTARLGRFMVDVGANVGWYSTLAAVKGLPVVAYEADPEHARLCAQNVARYAAEHAYAVYNDRIDGTVEMPLLVTRLAKIDVEGNEHEAVEAMWLSIERGFVDHILIEVSPCFRDDYPQLVRKIMQQGYDCYRIPPKHRPPIDLSNVAAVMEQHRVSLGEVDEVVNGSAQQNMWLRRIGADW